MSFKLLYTAIQITFGNIHEMWLRVASDDGNVVLSDTIFPARNGRYCARSLCENA